MKRALLIVLVLMIISTVWCQNGTPQVLSAQIAINGGVADFVAVGNIGYIAGDNLTKINLSTREIIWAKPILPFYGNNENQGMFESPDGCLIFTIGGFVTKMSTEDDTLWQTILPSEVALSLDEERSRVICYSWGGFLSILDMNTGQIIKQQQIPFEQMAYCSSHSAYAVGQNSFILFDTITTGGVGGMVSKIILENDTVNLVWQYQVNGVTNVSGKVKGNKIFFKYFAFDNTSDEDTRIAILEDLGDSYSILNTINAGGPGHQGLRTMIVINDLILTVGHKVTDENVGYDNGYNAVFNLYGVDGETRASQTNTQSDFCVYRGLAISQGCYFTVLISKPYLGGQPTYFLTELTGIYNSAVGNDPDTPATPQLSLTCYPTPTRVGNNVNVRFESKSRDNVIVEVYNIKGQKVKTLVNQSLSSGEHQTVWNGKTENNQPVASGMYFFRMKSGRFTATRKIILMK